MRLRPHQPGDLGWILKRQAEYYLGQLGYGPVFETYLARSIVTFLEGHDSDRDRVWVAQDDDGAILGFIAIQHTDTDLAQLRWFLVEPEARGHGVGARLLQEAIDFARRGYAGILLWTMDDLPAARRLYERAGFTLTDETEAPWSATARQQRFDISFRVS